MYRALGGAPLALPLTLTFILLAVFAALFDNGALLAPLLGDVSYTANYLHELFHDGRHLLGAPCH